MDSDSDFSDDEFQLSNEKPTFLAFVDKRVEPQEEVTIEDTFAGGQPLWLGTSKPDESLLECKNCKSPLALLVQAYAPLEGEDYDRVIYVFGCKNPECFRLEGSVRAIRGVRKDSEMMAEKARKFEAAKAEAEAAKAKAEAAEREKKQKLGSLGSVIFGGGSGANPFAADANPFAKKETVEAEKVAEVAEVAENPKVEGKSQSQKSPTPQSTPQTKPQSANLPHNAPTYPAFFLYVEEETLRQPTKPKIDTKSIKIESEDAESATPMSSKIKQLESDPEMLKRVDLDPMFAHFTQIVEMNSTQVLRYNLGSRPLLYSSKDSVAEIFIPQKSSDRLAVPSVPPIPGSGSSRQFELQLMPRLITVLEKGGDIVNGMEWGTVIVATATDDWHGPLDAEGVAYVEEWVGVQWE